MFVRTGSYSSGCSGLHSASPGVTSFAASHERLLCGMRNETELKEHQVEIGSGADVSRSAAACVRSLLHPTVVMSMEDCSFPWAE